MQRNVWKRKKQSVNVAVPQGKRLRLWLSIDVDYGCCLPCDTTINPTTTGVCRAVLSIITENMNSANITTTQSTASDSLPVAIDDSLYPTPYPRLFAKTNELMSLDGDDNINNLVRSGFKKELVCLVLAAHNYTSGRELRGDELHAIMLDITAAKSMDDTVDDTLGRDITDSPSGTPVSIRGGAGFDFSNNDLIENIIRYELSSSAVLEGDDSDDRNAVDAVAYLDRIEEIFERAGLVGITRGVYWNDTVRAEMDRVAESSLDEDAAKMNMLRLFRHMNDIIKAWYVPKVEEINETRSPLWIEDKYNHVATDGEAKGGESFKMYELKCHQRPVGATYLFGIEAASIGPIIIVRNGIPVDVSGPGFHIEFSFQEPILFMDEGRDVETSDVTLDDVPLAESRILSNGHILTVNGFTYELVVTCNWSIIPSNSASRISKRDRHDKMAEELTSRMGSKLFSADDSLIYVESFFTDHPHELPDDKTHLTVCYRNALACTKEALQNLHIYTPYYLLLRCMRELYMDMDKKYWDLIDQQIDMYNSIEIRFNSIDWWRLGYDIGGTVSAENSNDVTLTCPPNIDPVA